MKRWKHNCDYCGKGNKVMVHTKEENFHFLMIRKCYLCGRYVCEKCSTRLGGSIKWAVCLPKEKRKGEYTKGIKYE